MKVLLAYFSVERSPMYCERRRSAGVLSCVKQHCTRATVSFVECRKQCLYRFSVALGDRLGDVCSELTAGTRNRDVVKRRVAREWGGTAADIPTIVLPYCFRTSGLFRRSGIKSAGHLAIRDLSFDCFGQSPISTSTRTLLMLVSYSQILRSASFVAQNGHFEQLC